MLLARPPARYVLAAMALALHGEQGSALLTLGVTPSRWDASGAQAGSGWLGAGRASARAAPMSPSR